jgi:hypothetical protein
MVGPTGPRRLRLAIEHWPISAAALLLRRPRSALGEEGLALKQFDQARAYMDHVVDQAVTLLKHRKITGLFTTPKLLEALAEKVDLYEAGIRGVFCGGTTMAPQYVRFIVEEVLEGRIGFLSHLRQHAHGPGRQRAPDPEDQFSITYYAPQPRAVLRVVRPQKTTELTGLRPMGPRRVDHPDPRVLHAALSRTRRGHPPPAAPPYAWDGVAEVRPFGAMEKQIVEGVYCPDRSTCPIPFRHDSAICRPTARRWFGPPASNPTRPPHGCPSTRCRRCS